MWKMDKSVVVVLSLAVLGIGLGACNTVGGAGQDIERAGENIQDAAY